MIRIMSSNIWGNWGSEVIVADRTQKLAAIYRRYLPDSIGFQEFSPAMRQGNADLSLLIRELYAEVPVVPENPTQNNYAPIFYRPEHLTLVDFGCHLYSGLNDKGSKSLTWALFENKEDKTRFLHFNTHYYWTGDAAGKAARICNTGELLAVFWKVAAQYECPAILTGDLNCRKNEPPVLVLLKSGFSDVRRWARVSSSHCSLHAYPTYCRETDCYEPSPVPTKAAERSIDYILANGLYAERFVTVIDSEALCASDHCPVFADFSMER